jgi:hypothetical protein
MWVVYEGCCSVCVGLLCVILYIITRSLAVGAHAGLCFIAVA